MVNKALRIVIYSIFSISLLFVVPFNNIYASVQSTIVPTFSSSTSQWNGHLYVTNFSDGTNNQASSTLSFTFDDDYYGIIYFDGYGPSNQHIANYASCYVAGGYGEYRYSYYQNGVINITSVTINIVSVVKPETTVDLTQIITLLTAIENDTSSIDNVLDTTLAQIRLVLAELIESNGYLNEITQLRQWNIPIESFAPNIYMFKNQFPIIELMQYNNFQIPLYQIVHNDVIYKFYSSSGETYKFIYLIDLNAIPGNIPSLFTFNDGQIQNIRVINRFNDGTLYWTIFYFELSNFTISGMNQILYNNWNHYFFPFLATNSIYNLYSTDFALQFGLTNNLLDNISLIANGTNASSVASSQSDQANSQLQQDSNTLFQQEDSFKQNMNSAMQNIDTTFSLNNFGTSFMASAMWVRQQYERLTNNTPFASLITFSLLVGLALIVVGKVYK